MAHAVIRGRAYVGDVPDQCSQCGFVHVAGELFVVTGKDKDGWPVYDETCELQAAWEGAHRERSRRGQWRFTERVT